MCRVSQAKFLLDKYIAGLCFNRTAFPVQKSGLKSSAFRSKSFPQISSESYRHNAVSNRFSSHLSTSPTNAATLASMGCGGYTRHPSPEPCTQRLTGRNTGPSLPRPQRGFALPVNSFLFRHAFIYIHFPILCEPSPSAEGENSAKLPHKFYPPTVSHPDF